MPSIEAPVLAPGGAGDAGGAGLVPAGTTREELLSGTVRRAVLPGGLRVLTERVPGVRSVAVGVWVAVGSRDETPRTAGCSHYLEHLLFKGTERRDALTISSSLEAVGGDLNAFTAKEYTCFHARVLDDDLPLAVDVVCDMVTSSLIAEADVDAERGVILEEIAMCDDEPGDLVHDVFASALLGDSALGRPILGTTGSIEGMARDTVAEYYHSWYTPPRLVVAIAGNIDHDRALGLVAEAFAGRLTAGPGPVAVRAGRPDAPAGTGVAVLRRPIEQANVVLGTTCMSRLDDRRYALGLLSSVLGGGMSSRLLQEIREKRGLAYSVYTFVSHYADTGLFGVYAGCAPRRVDEVLALCREQLADVAAAGVTAEELERAKGQSRGSLVLNLEDTGSRMSRIGKGELMYGELQSVDEVLARVNAVTLDDVRAVAADLLSGPMALGVIGPFDDHDFSAALG